MLTGQYRIKIDKRRRFRIPSLFMKAFKEEIIIEKNIFHPFLEIIPLSVFEKKADFINSGLNPSKEKDRRILEAFFDNFLLVNARNQTITLPLDFYNHLLLEGKNELILIGMRNTIRVSAKYKNKAAAITKSEFLKRLNKRNKQG